MDPLQEREHYLSEDSRSRRLRVAVLSLNWSFSMEL